MVVQKYKDMLQGKSVIRQLSEFATARGAEIGYENVFDYSLGNPSVPAPQASRSQSFCSPTALKTLPCATARASSEKTIRT